MAHPAGSYENRRYQRAKGPFGGRHIGPTKTHVFVTDLNLGGGFIKFTDEEPQGSLFVLRIKLHDGPITVTAQTVHRDQAGHGVRFVNLDIETAKRLVRAAAISQSSSAAFS